jgi:hypothetical protein
MGARVGRLVDRIRAEKGPFFVARLCLRVNFSTDESEPDTPEVEKAILDACRQLGYDASAVAGAGPER